MDNGDRRRSVRRFEDIRFLTGHGRYVEDFVFAGEVHAYVLRSPHAHAVIEHIDTASVQAVSGALCCLSSCMDRSSRAFSLGTA